MKRNFEPKVNDFDTRGAGSQLKQKYDRQFNELMEHPLRMKGICISSSNTT